MLGLAGRLARFEVTAGWMVVCWVGVVAGADMILCFDSEELLDSVASVGSPAERTPFGAFALGVLGDAFGGDTSSVEMDIGCGRFFLRGV